MARDRLHNLALQGYSQAHPRSGRWLVGFGWGVVVGSHPTNPHAPNPTKNLFARAHLLGQNMVSDHMSMFTRDA